MLDLSTLRIIEGHKDVGLCLSTHNGVKHATLKRNNRRVKTVKITDGKVIGDLVKDHLVYEIDHKEIKVGDLIYRPYGQLCLVTFVNKTKDMVDCIDVHRGITGLASIDDRTKVFSLDNYIYKAH